MTRTARSMQIALAALAVASAPAGAAPAAAPSMDAVTGAPR